MNENSDMQTNAPAPTINLDVPATAAERTRDKEHIEQFFAYAHLPAQLQAVSKPFGDLARDIIDVLPRNPERTVALRKLLEAKDAAVRALVAK